MEEAKILKSTSNPVRYFQRLSQRFEVKRGWPPPPETMICIGASGTAGRGGLGLGLGYLQPCLTDEWIDERDWIVCVRALRAEEEIAVKTRMIQRRLRRVW